MFIFNFKRYGLFQISGDTWLPVYIRQPCLYDFDLIWTSCFARWHLQRNTQQLVPCINACGRSKRCFPRSITSYAMAVFLAFFMLLLIVKIPQPGECRNIRQAFFRKIQQKRLENLVIDTKQTNDELECVIHCIEDGSCTSVNYKTSGIGKDLCELNNSTLLNTPDVVRRIRNPEFDHLYIVKKVRKSHCCEINMFCHKL